MKTVRPLGLCFSGFLVMLMFSGCVAMFGSKPTASVQFVEGGVPVTVSLHEYLSLRGNLQTLLAERNLALVDLSFHSRMIAIVEIKTTAANSGRAITDVRVARVIHNPKVEDLGPGMAGYWVNPSNAGMHPSFDLTRNFEYGRSY